MLLIETDGICLSCRIDLHEECTVALAGDLPDGERCCCVGLYDRAAHLGQVARARKAAGAGDVASGDEEGSPAAVAAPPAPIKGDSGYIHPDAWPSSADIGTLADVSSTGRKRVAKMYPITAGQVCEWAKLRYAGNGPKPIIGCMGNPASELHHGPDKNTLNNEKASRGVGTRENVHVICSDCVTPRMRVLMRDLTWREAGEIVVGDEIVAFDEAIEGSANGALLMPATVTAVSRVQEPSFRFNMANGAVLESSHRHKWVASSPARHHLKWRTTESLKPRYNLRLLVDPWDTSTDFESGWLAGMFDGEGSLTRYHLSIGQNIGAVLEKARELILSIARGHMNVQARPAGVHKFSTGGIRTSSKDFEQLRLTNLPDVLRVLGSVRPIRLLARAEEYWVGKSVTAVEGNRTAIELVEDMGTVEVVSITTSTGTLIVEGFLSHNCHNAWHAANDEFYPDYNRDAQQTEPWIPYHPGEWGPQDSAEQASFDELVEVARVRDERRRKRGRDTAGRNSKPRAGVDLGVDPDEG